MITNNSAGKCLQQQISAHETEVTSIYPSKDCTFAISRPVMLSIRVFKFVPFIKSSITLLNETLYSFIRRLIQAVNPLTRVLSDMAIYVWQNKKSNTKNCYE